jgi:hypothetical protein
MGEPKRLSECKFGPHWSLAFLSPLSSLSPSHHRTGGFFFRRTSIVLLYYENLSGSPHPRPVLDLCGGCVGLSELVTYVYHTHAPTDQHRSPAVALALPLLHFPAVVHPPRRHLCVVWHRWCGRLDCEKLGAVLTHMLIRTICLALPRPALVLPDVTGAAYYLPDETRSAVPIKDNGGV